MTSKELEPEEVQPTFRTPPEWIRIGAILIAMEQGRYPLQPPPTAAPDRDPPPSPLAPVCTLPPIPLPYLCRPSSPPRIHRSNTSGAPWGNTADFFSSPRRVLFLRVGAAGAGCALLAPAEDDEGEDVEAGEGGGGGGLRLVAIRWARVTCALKNKRGDMVSRSGTSTLVCDPGRRRASDKCVKEKRKTINGDDLIWSMGTLGFEDYVEPLKLHLKLYQQAFEFKRLLLYYNNVHDQQVLLMSSISYLAIVSAIFTSADMCSGFQFLHRHG
ncbi:uncharacterized protein [Triticum aestivum]|uniref:uncharacterized protein n=1 Tax=Triticum aestivum TaxID=4565 RepID=UPI001D02D8CD|nr:uncharacterized protein LOC123056903 [Triticum aestivum]